MWHRNSVFLLHNFKFLSLDNRKKCILNALFVLSHAIRCEAFKMNENAFLSYHTAVTQKTIGSKISQIDFSLALQVHDTQNAHT